MRPLQDRLSLIQSRIVQASRKSGRDPRNITLLGVSKGQSAKKILELARAGLRDFGENYVQEWSAKKSEIESLDPALAAELRWHFIGHLQTNKAERVAGRVALLQSIDSPKLAAKVSSLAEKDSLRQNALIEINLGGEASKTGLDPKALREQLKFFSELPGIRWRGLMTIPPPLETPEASRPYFRELKSLLDECGRTGFFEEPLTELSMGMSQDFEVAIEEGATLVRVGTALFGPRL
ncbi:MAG: YggS family pyridoxal phosphate-dependent enzyme [Deltaproteobacteria bacterium]|nr:YggS family pyridoxal phosphate-dependent enzyme [Deltaproteobacteria bacterium]